MQNSSVPPAERKGQVLLRAGTSGAALVVMDAVLNHKATHCKSLWSQSYNQVVPNFPYLDQLNSQNVNGKINNIFFRPSCQLYLLCRESLPNSFKQFPRPAELET